VCVCVFTSFPFWETLCEAGSDGINIFMSLILSTLISGSARCVRCSVARLLGCVRCPRLRFAVARSLLLLSVRFLQLPTQIQNGPCRFCFHFVGLTTAFFAFYTPIWVGISLASIAVEAVATFQILGKKFNPVTKMSRFTRPFGLGVLAGRVEKEIVPSKQNKRKDRRKTRSKADEVQIENRVAHIITVHCYEYT
jgi:hypothetical protein